jgi:hypothetical protein
MNAIPINSNILEQLLSGCDPAFSVGITLQVMAISGQSTRNQSAIYPILKGSQHVDQVHASRTRNLNNLD